VPKILISNTTIVFFLTAVIILVISNHNSFQVLFDEIAYVYFTWKIYIYILAMEMATRGYQHFASCIGTLLFPVIISAPLKLRPYGAIQICLLLLLSQSRRQEN